MCLQSVLPKVDNDFGGKLDEKIQVENEIPALQIADGLCTVNALVPAGKYQFPLLVRQERN
jgi:hypothetical protein